MSAFALVVATFGIAAPPVSALTTCTFSDGEVAVTISGGFTPATIVRSGDAIHVNGVACDTADVHNTDLITVTDETGLNSGVTLDLTGGPFAPGADDEDGESDEIEFAYVLGPENSDNLTIAATTGPDHFVVGAGGVNLNADEPDGIDHDITLSGVDGLISQLGDGADELSGAGGSGTGSATNIRMIITPGDGDDDVIGGDGTDTFSSGDSGDGADTFIGGGSDSDSASYLGRTASMTFTLSGGADDGEAGEGDDIRSDNLNSGAGDDVIIGSDGPNSIFGHNGHDDIDGSGGDDTFVQGLIGDGDDDLTGGPGIDHVAYFNRFAAQPVFVTIDGIADDGASGELDNVRTDIENLTGGAGNDELTGSGGANVLSGANGNDELVGGDGNDTLDGDAGIDAYDGGPGDDLFLLQEVGIAAETVIGGEASDTADYEQTSVPVTVTLDEIANDGRAGEEDNLLVENVTGGNAVDDITGDGGPNVLHGGGGNDTLNGGDGDDILAGDSGGDTENGQGDDDRFDQGAGAEGGDTLNGGDGGDTADYSGRAVGVFVALDGFANDGQGEADRVGGTANDVEHVIGGTAGDVLTGNGADNDLSGGPGDDQLNGGDGNDALDGGAGGDELDGGAHNDTVTYAERSSAVIASIGGGTDDGEDANADGVAEEQDDIQTTIENVVGGTGNDRLTGDGQANVLIGGNGNDRLAGGAGADIENGGAGADTFEQGATADGGDILNGGSEIDLVDYSARTTNVVAGPGGASDGEDANGDRVADEADTIGADIENVTGGTAKDRLLGNELPNIMLGGPGRDALFGAAGRDVLKGQRGTDKANGGRGKDRCSAEREISC